MSNIPRKEGSLLKFENLELRNDKEIVEIAIKSLPHVLDSASQWIKSDKEFVMKYIIKMKMCTFRSNTK
jgi:hypothetical protein